MEFDLEGFVGDPTIEKLDGCTVEHLKLIAGRYSVDVSGYVRKPVIKERLLSVLAEQGVLTAQGAVSPREPGEVVFNGQIRMKELELELRRLELKEKEMTCHFEVRKLEEETKRVVRLKELELEIGVAVPSLSTGGRTHGESAAFDVTRHIRLLPVFSEKDVDTFFILFERIATTMKWPKDLWTVLLQCVLTGKAQEVYAALSSESSLDFYLVKAAVLKAYELVPEAYRQRFRRHRRLETQAYVEFAREKEGFFDRWCLSQGVETLGDLRALVLVEEFKNCLPEEVTTYLNENKTVSLSDAAVLADEYALTHKLVFEKTMPQERHTKSDHVVSVQSGRYGASVGEEKPGREDRGTRERPVCYYCKKPGHLIASCYALQGDRQPTKTVVCAQTVRPKPKVTPESRDSELDVYAPFLMGGEVSLTQGGSKVPVTILRDTAASQSFILSDVLPLSRASGVDSSVIVRGFGMQRMGSPLHTIYLESDLVTGPVVVGVRPCFPIEGVSFLLGNDLAGGRVLVKPEVTVVPMVTESNDRLAQKYPGVFSACAVPRAMTKHRPVDDDVGLSGRFLDLTATPVSGQLSTGEAGELAKENLNAAQKRMKRKVEAIRDFPAPASRRDLRCFLGMAGCYRGFCKNFSAVAAPLTDLTSPKVRFVWSEGCQYAFEQIKDLLSNAPVLAAPNFEQPFKLAIDACGVGAGAVLLQDGADGVEHPVSYFSRKFNRHQRVYSTIEKEALAIVLALNHFEVYVGSASVSVTIYTDHNPLVYLKSMRSTNQRLMRWSIFLQAFNVVIKHIRGKDNVVADALSRL